MALEIGQKAPDFTLTDQNGNDVALSGFTGNRAVAVVFYPFTFTGVCEGELCQLRDDYSVYEDAGVQVLAISCDSKFSQAKWAQEMGYQFPVLSDFWPHGEVSRAYGVFDDEHGCAKRGTFIIDRDGILVDHFDSPALTTPREYENYKAALAKLAA